MAEPKGKHLFGIVKVGEKGQVVIPKKARDIFSIAAGDSLMVMGDEASGLAMIPLGRFKEIFFRAIEGDPDFFATLNEDPDKDGETK